MLLTNTSSYCALNELGHLMANQAVETPNAVITSVAAVASAVITSGPAVASTAAPWAPWALAVGIVKKALGNKEKAKLRTEVSNLRTENEGLRTENEGLRTENEGLRTEYENLRKRKGDADATILEQGIKIAKLEEKHEMEDSPSTPAHEVELEDETQKAGPASASLSPAGSSPKNAVVLD